MSGRVAHLLLPSPAFENNEFWSAVIGSGYSAHITKQLHESESLSKNLYFKLHFANILATVFNKSEIQYSWYSKF
jgi:hypothetical protein